MKTFPNLFTPIKIGTMEINNRIFMSAMGTNYAEPLTHAVTQRMIDYYVARAKGGSGLIIVEDTVVEERGGWSDCCTGIWSDEFIEGYKNLTEAVHNEGAKIILQLGHLGRTTSEELNGGFKPISASPVPDCFMDNEVDEITLEEIIQIKKAYVDALRRTKDAGFDGGELHCTHGYLLASFISGRTNKRTDEYGGTFEGRLRLLLEIIADIRREVGRDFPLLVRLAATENNGGRMLEETKVIAKALADAGIDALDISSGSSSERDWIIPPSYFSHAMNMVNIESIKKSIDIPVLASGHIVEPRMAEQLIAEGRTDMVGINRGVIADPDWAKKAGSGETDEIRRCVGCTRCIESLDYGPLRCSVNPYVGCEGEIDLSPSSVSKKVLIVGGGPTGLECAILAAQKGHSVLLVEKEKKMGGQIKSAAVPPFQYELGGIITVQVYRAKKLGVEILTGQEVTPEFVKSYAPDAVIVAAGAKHAIPPIPGINNEIVITAVELLEGKKHAGKHVVIMGGGLVGCETAEFLGQYDKKISIIDMKDEIGEEVASLKADEMFKNLKNADVDVIVKAKVTCISDNSITYEKEGQPVTIEDIDTVVVALGMRPETELYQSLQDGGVPVHLVGDADCGGNLMESLKGCYKVVCKLV